MRKSTVFVGMDGQAETIAMAHWVVAAAPAKLRALVDALQVLRGVAKVTAVDAGRAKSAANRSKPELGGGVV